jgi:hypothetical protein
MAAIYEHKQDHLSTAHTFRKGYRKIRKYQIFFCTECISNKYRKQAVSNKAKPKREAILTGRPAGLCGGLPRSPLPRNFPAYDIIVAYGCAWTAF